MHLFREAVAIVQDYLGPAAERFMTRQIEFHLKKKPDEITKEDVEKLTEWVRVSLGLLTEDKKVVDECVQRLQQAARE
jgi:hypothetical protein